MPQSAKVCEKAYLARDALEFANPLSQLQRINDSIGTMHSACSLLADQRWYKNELVAPGNPRATARTSSRPLNGHWQAKTGIRGAEYVVVARALAGY